MGSAGNLATGWPETDFSSSLSLFMKLQHKFASNVVEKCLQYGSKAERNDIIEEVVRSVLEKYVVPFSPCFHSFSRVSLRILIPLSPTVPPSVRPAFVRLTFPFLPCVAWCSCSGRRCCR